MGSFVSRYKRISKQDLEFLKKNTKYSEEKIREWYRNFQRECPDGNMDGAQFLRAYQALFPDLWKSQVSETYTAKFLGFVFQAFDQDRSGQLEFKEFLLFVNMISDGTPEEKLIASFKIFDLDGNGSISEIELFRVIKALLVMQSGSVEGSAASTNKILARLDKDKNGKISLNEYLAVCQNDEVIYKLLVENKSVVIPEEEPEQEQEEEPEQKQEEELEN